MVLLVLGIDGARRKGIRQKKYIVCEGGMIILPFLNRFLCLTSQIFFLSGMIRLSQQISNWNRSLLTKVGASFMKDRDEPHYHPVRGFFPSESMGSYTYSPRSQSFELLSEEEIEKEARSIFQWAKNKGAERYSFIAYPHTDGIFEKQDSFLNLAYTMDKRGFKETIAYEFPGSILTKGEGDGSSVPSGGLRQTHTARAYMLWDSHSNLYVRSRNKTLYIPSLLVTHHGKPLDMKTLFRMSQRALEKQTLSLLEKLGVEATATKLFVGLQQQFFVVPTEAFEKREDLKWLGRTLVGTNPRRNQQLGEHYYAKLPRALEKALADIQAELLQIGIPFKTRHNEVAVNQFEIACIYGEAGITIDQNIIVMQIMRETFQRYGLTALFHEKPFGNINGSGKHANYNLAYVQKNGAIKNVFKRSSSDTPLDTQVYKLFMLIQLMAAMKHEKLYMTSLATPGNEVRLGGHEAPPRIFSVFLGEGASNLLDGKPAPVVQNLREVINTLNYDVYQQNSDRNRTSPFAYTGRVFEFRALGSSQNTAFPMAVIAATMCYQIEQVNKLLESGKSIKQVIDSYLQQTRKIRFQGDGYSQEWKEEAKKRGLYVNEKYSELYTFLETEQEVFTKIGVSTPEENQARFEIAKSSYNNTVAIEAETLIYIGRRHIVPQGFAYLKSISGDCQEAPLNPYYKEIKRKLENVVTELSAFEQLKKSSTWTLKDCQKLREEVHRVGEVMTKLIAMLPNSEKFPDQSTFLNL